MPTRAVRRCAKQPCPELVTATYCTGHEAERRRARNERSDAGRLSARARGYDSVWEARRLAHLAKEPLCRLCKQNGRVTAATVVDHIIPHKGDRALFDDDGNLQSLCKPCHDHKTACEDSTFAHPVRGGPTRPTYAPAIATPVLVCGPPGSGKSRYVDQHRQPGELVLDMDALYHALTGLPLYHKPDTLLPYVASARDAVIEKLARTIEPPRAWIIAGGATRAERTRYTAPLRATVVMLAVPADECLRRITADPRRVGSGIRWHDLVTDWWGRYEPA